MRCPFCGYEESRVVDSRPTEENEKIRRRRECLKCNSRFTTYEVIETVPIMVVKKDKSRQAFDREKLMRGILRSCEKRPVSSADIEKLVDQIESELSNSLQREVSSYRIGELVMKHLKYIDEVAYVRFASVYRDFGDIDAFMQELRTLKKDK